MNWGAEIVFLVVVFLAAVFSLPPTVEDLRQGDKSLPMKEDEPLETEIFNAQESREEESLGLRFRRVTCDILSISVPFGSLNHSACAAHCLAKMKGFRGGRCIQGVCHCRK